MQFNECYSLQMSQHFRVYGLFTHCYMTEPNDEVDASVWRKLWHGDTDSLHRDSLGEVTQAAAYATSMLHERNTEGRIKIIITIMKSI